MNSSMSNTRGTWRATAAAGALKALAFVGVAACAASPASAGGVRGDGREFYQPEVIQISPRGQTGAEAGSRTSYVYHSNDNGKVVHIEITDGTVTKAEVDGQSIPDERIQRDGDLVKLLGADGSVLIEHRVPKADVVTLGGSGAGRARSFALRAPGSGTFSWAPQAPGVPPVPGVPGSVEPVVAPKVMIGVQMATPDDALRGHLGLKQGQSTMLGAIHEGLPASKAGLEPYDLIVGIDGKDEASPEAVRAALKDKNPGDSLKLTVIQKGVRKDVTLTLEAYDRKKLDESKVAAIADRDSFAAWAPNADAFARSWSGQGDGWTRWLREPGANSFIGVIPGPDGKQQRLLLDDPTAARELADQLREAAEEARAEAERLHEQFMKERGTAMEQMQKQIEEMQRMMKKLIEEKLQERESKEQDRAPEHRS